MTKKPILVCCACGKQVNKKDPQFREFVTGANNVFVHMHKQTTGRSLWYKCIPEKIYFKYDYQLIEIDVGYFIPALLEKKGE